LATAAQSRTSAFANDVQLTSHGRILEDSSCLCADEPDNEEVTTVRMLMFHTHAKRFAPKLAPYFEKTGINVELIESTDYGQFVEEMLLNTESGVYEGYYFLPDITAELDMKNGMADLTELVANNDDLEWTDILPFNRKIQATYNGAVKSIPCDGDLFSLFYRKDLFEKYNRTVPRTWDEYAETAAFFHGMQVPGLNGSNTTVTLSGSCIERGKQCNWAYYFNVLVHASVVQAQRTVSGHYFDTDTFEPLFGEGLAETLRILEELAKYGAPEGAARK